MTQIRDFITTRHRHIQLPSRASALMRVHTLISEVETGA